MIYTYMYLQNIHVCVSSDFKGPTEYMCRSLTLYLSVYLSICLSVYLYLSIYLSMHASFHCVCVCMCAYVCVCMCAYVCVCMCACVCVCMCAYVCVCMCAYVCVCVSADFKEPMEYTCRWLTRTRGRGLPAPSTNWRKLSKVQICRTECVLLYRMCFLV
jgi:hypothetical protein